MLGIVLDTLILMALLKIINDDDIDFGTVLFVALGASIGAAVLVMVLSMVIGIFGLFLGAAIAAGALGVALSALFGMEIKRAFLIGGLFMVARICVAFGLQLMFSV